MSQFPSDESCATVEESPEYDAYRVSLILPYVEECRERLNAPDVDPIEFWKWHSRRGYEIGRSCAQFIFDKARELDAKKGDANGN